MKERKNPPAGNQGASSKSTAADFLDSTADRRHSTPTAQDRRESALLAELRDLGYTVAVSCTQCGHPLVSPKSIARGHIGPKCAAKTAVTR